jgi:transposase-like protein
VAHPRAKLTVAGRRLLVERVVEQGWPPVRAAEAQGVSLATVYKWLRRWRAEGLAGLADRSCRPHSSPRRLSNGKVERFNLTLARELAYARPYQSNQRRLTPSRPGCTTTTTTGPTEPSTEGAQCSYSTTSPARTPRLRRARRCTVGSHGLWEDPMGGWMGRASTTDHRRRHGTTPDLRCHRSPHAAARGGDRCGCGDGDRVLKPDNPSPGPAAAAPAAAVITNPGSTRRPAAAARARLAALMPATAGSAAHRLSSGRVCIVGSSSRCPAWVIGLRRWRAPHTAIRDHAPVPAGDDPNSARGMPDPPAERPPDERHRCEPSRRGERGDDAATVHLVS